MRRIKPQTLAPKQHPSDRIPTFMAFVDLRAAHQGGDLQPLWHKEQPIEQVRLRGRLRHDHHATGARELERGAPRAQRRVAIFPYYGQ